MILIYRGAGVIAVTTFESKNPKTGPMDQVWILDENVNPHTTYKLGTDGIVCGNCKRSSKPNGGDGSCYVQTAWAPSAVFKKYQKERDSLIKTYPLNLSLQGMNRSIRVGAYGDPAFVPSFVWSAYLSKARMYTGYTHQWKVCDQNLKNFFMASVDSEHEAVEAQSLGWRTFRVYKGTLSRKPKEATCPSSKESGHKLMQCIICPDSLRCDGIKPGKLKHNIVIREH